MLRNYFFFNFKVNCQKKPDVYMSICKLAVLSWLEYLFINGVYG